MPTSPRAVFRSLHTSGCFVMPNPWDVGSAVFLQSLGFPALATTSAGFAFTRALPDSVAALTRDDVLRHAAELASAVRIPVNVDFQSGYADTPQGVAESVSLCVATGISGLSIEDATGDDARPLYEIPEALERLRAARDAIDRSPADNRVLLTARAECFLTGHPDPLRESLRRIEAYAPHADVLFVPGVRTREDIKAVVSAAGGKPVNVLIGWPGMNVKDLADLGVRRISVGSALARAAWAGFIRAATALAKEGSFAAFDNLTTFADLNAMFGKAPGR